jgi:two-component system, cell cycle sensor histidine kinase and response regulator CckA
VAVSATTLTLLLRVALDGPLEGRPTLVLFTLPIVLSAYVGGLRAGLMATAVSHLAASYFLLPPLHSFQVASGPERWQLAALLVAGACISALSGALHGERRRADLATDASRVAEEGARRGEQRLRDLIDGLGPSLFVGLLTPDGVLVEANQSALVAARLRREDVLGQPFDETPWWTHSPEAQQRLRDAMARAARGEVSRFDVELRTPADGVISIDFSLQVVRDEAGEVEYLVPSASVTTEREQAIAALRRSEAEQRRVVGELEKETARLVAAQTVSKVGSWETDLASGEVTWSAETYRILELDAAGFTPTSSAFLDRVHPEDRAAAYAAFFHSSGGPGEQAIEHRVLLPDGRIKFVEERWQTIVDSLGVPVRAIGTCQDVTARKQAAEALQEMSRRTGHRERMLTTTLSALHDFAYIYDRGGRFLFANQPLLDLWGITLEEAVGKNFFELGYPRDLAERLQREIQQVFDARRSVTGETAYTSPTGAAGVYEYIFSPALGGDGTVEFVVGSTRDITERKQAAEALATSLKEFRALAEAMPQMVWITRPDGWNLYFNHQWMDYTGLTLEESLGHGWNKPFHPDDQQRAWDAWQQATERVGTYSLECRLRRADGAYRWWLIRGVPVMDASRNVSKWFGTCTDIHELKVAEQERKGAERRLLESAEEYRVLFDGNPHPMWVFDSETLGFLAVNDAAVRLYGFSRDEFLGMTIKDIRPPEEVPALLEHLRTIADKPDTLATQTRHSRKDGSRLEVDGASNPIEFHGRRARLVLAHDATEKKQLQAQLVQALKMDAVGRLAGGVAHDFNNSLGVILGFTELLIRDASEAQQGKLQQILKATQRASGLTRQLLAFSRKEVVSPRVLDLNALLADLEEMLPRLIGEHIDVAFLPGKELGHVMADPGQLQQVVMNLCVNARDAMPNGGLLRLETGNADHLGSSPPGAQEPIAAGRYVRLAVTDAGVGIAKELHSKIFEPFFTTKGVGEGTGLGLSMVYGIVKQAGGHIWVDSEVGRGTTFTIYLPRTDTPLTHALKAAPVSSRGWETILLTEDEEALRAIACEILEEHGYRVLEAAGPSHAIGIVRDQHEPIHLLLTDVVMPGMNGRALADALQAVRPELKVLYMSGYTDDILAQSGVLATTTLLLHKPFTTNALLEAVRAALEQGERSTP